MVQDKKKHREAFYVPAEYLLEHEEGLASGPESMNNYGLELSRSFKALKVWISVKTHGLQWFTSHISMNIDQALYLKKRIDESSKLKIMNNVAMNIVCFQYQCENPINNNIVNKNICMALQTKGIASPSSTIRHGEYVLRVAITNHKSTFIDFDILVDACIELGNEYERSMS